MTAILLGLWATLLLARGTPIGRWLDAALVVAPARRLSRVSPGQWLILATLLLSVGMVLWFLEEEGRVLLSMGAPELVGFLSAAEVSAYADILAAALITLSAGTPARVMAHLRPWLVRVRSGRTQRRRPRLRPDQPSANDDEPGGTLRLAA
jgi:hypothetical protein